MKRMWLFLILSIMVLSACNLAYRRPEDVASANIVEQAGEFARSAPEIIVALPSVVPTAEPLTTCTPRVDWLEYGVVSGDTLSGIAVRSRSTVAELAEANCIDNPSLIIEGQRIYVRQQPVAPTPVHDSELEIQMTENKPDQ